MKQALYVLVIIVVIAGAWLLAQATGLLGEKNEVSQTASSTPWGSEANDIPLSSATSSAATQNATSSTSTSASLKTFTVTGQNFSFTPATMTVKKGDRVRIVFENAVGFHDLVIDEYNVRTRQISGAGTDTIEFTADKAGTFEYYCSVGNHRAMGMKGKLTVAE